MKLKSNSLKILFAFSVFVLISFLFATEKSQSEILIANDSIKVILPESKHKTETRLVTSILSRYHYKKFSLNDSLSSVIFDEFINSLDNGKNYFLASDIKEFEKSRYKIDDFLINEDILKIKNKEFLIFFKEEFLRA